MSDINIAVDAIRKQARLYEPLVKVAAELEQIGSLENARKEHERTIKALGEEKVRLNEEIKLIKAKSEAEVAVVKNEVAELREEANAYLNAAREEASKVVADAKSNALKIESDANEYEANIKLKITNESDRSLAEIKAAKYELDGVNKAVAQKNEELALAQTQLDEIKARLSALLGS